MKKIKNFGQWTLFIIVYCYIVWSLPYIAIMLVIKVPYWTKLSELNRAIKMNPQDAGLYYNRGRINSELGSRKKAIKDFTKAIKYNPQNYSIFPDIASSYHARGQEYRILGYKEKALLDYNLAANIYQERGDLEAYKRNLEDIKYLNQSQ